MIIGKAKTIAWEYTMVRQDTESKTLKISCNLTSSINICSSEYQLRDQLVNHKMEENMAKFTLDKGLVAKINKEILQHNNKKINN